MRKTFLLIHGAWVTPACWHDFRGFLEAQGHTCIVPAWPFMDRPVEALRRSPDPALAREHHATDSPMELGGALDSESADRAVPVIRGSERADFISLLQRKADDGLTDKHRIRSARIL